MSKLSEIFYERRKSPVGIHFIGADKNMDSILYKELYEDSLKLLKSFRENNISKSDEIVFQIYDNREFVTCLWACILGGIVAVPFPYVIRQVL